MLNKIREAISSVEAFRKDVVWIRDHLEALEKQSQGYRDLLQKLHGRQVELEGRMNTASLEWAELYGKTYKLLKRMQMEDRTQTEPEEVAPLMDDITARVMARRNRGLPG